MKQRTLYVPTLRDEHGSLHIIPAKDAPALCGATGEQSAPRDHRIDTLCLRCRQKQMKTLLDEKMTRFGL